jgi:hypothetical protein
MKFKNFARVFFQELAVGFQPVVRREPISLVFLALVLSTVSD